MICCYYIQVLTENIYKVDIILCKCSGNTDCHFSNRFIWCLRQIRLEYQSFENKRFLNDWSYEPVHLSYFLAMAKKFVEISLSILVFVSLAALVWTSNLAEWVSLIVFILFLFCQQISRFISYYINSYSKSNFCHREVKNWNNCVHKNSEKMLCRHVLCHDNWLMLAFILFLLLFL
jgi:hypothetical protein